MKCILVRYVNFPFVQQTKLWFPHCVI